MIFFPAWLHDLDPYAINFGSGLGLRWYGLSYIAGFAAAYFLLRYLARRRLVAFTPDRAFDIIVTLAVSAVVGGRIGYAVFYQPSLIWTFTGAAPFWDMLALNKGGMASHGGIIGAIFACWLISRGQKNSDGKRTGASPLLHATDTTVLIAPPGLFFGRVANFVNGELLGKVVAAPGEPAPAWAVKYPQEILTDHAPRLTEQQEIALVELVGEAAPTSLDFYEGYQILLERVQSGSADYAAQLEPLISARHPSQLYQAAAEGLAVGAVLWVIARAPRKPGVLSAAFLMSYGLLRIVTEVYRLPDAHLQVQRFAGFSRGQWLSALMVAAGIAMLIYAKRSTPKKLYFGWASRASSRA